MKRTVLPLLVLAFAHAASAQELLWHAVVESETKAMQCAVLTPPSEKEMKSFLEARVSDPEEAVDQTVLGIKFKDENPQMIQWFYGVHNLHYPRRADIDKAVLRHTSCDKVICALEKNYGQGMALPMLYIAAKFGLPTSPFLSEKRTQHQNWSLDELLDILVALEATPLSKIPFKDTVLFRAKNNRVQDSALGDEYKVLANATMNYFEYWSKQSRLKRIQTAIHEVGHVIGYGMDKEDDWKNTPQEGISKYALTNSAEGFAEAYTAYRIAPKKMKRSSPEAYAFFKNKVFNGLEFNSSAECEESFAALDNETAQVFRMRWKNGEWVKKNTEGINEELVRLEKYGVLSDLALRYCSGAYLAERTGGDREKTMQCFLNVFKKRAAVLEARERGREGMTIENTLISHVKDIKVPRHVALAMRDQLRNKINLELKAYFEQRKLQYFDEKEYFDYIAGQAAPEDTPFITQNRDGIRPIISKVLEKESQKFFVRRIFFTPSFQDYLPR